MTYGDIHARLFRERGKAAEYPCSQCGGTARDWAYTNAAGDLEKVDEKSGFRYADSTEFYEPLCRSCHRKFDLEHNPEHLAWKREFMAKVATETPPSRESRSRSGKARAKAQWERYWDDPDYRERRDAATAANAVKAREALATAHENDPDLRKRQTEAMRNSKSRCQECGKVSRPGSIGMHQKHSGHKGVEKV